jgi:hypothetical protein
MKSSGAEIPLPLRRQLQAPKHLSPTQRLAQSRSNRFSPNDRPDPQSS